MREWDDRARDAELLKRFPALAKPGPQPHNSDVADTLAEQLAKVFMPRLTPEQARRGDLAALVDDTVRRILLEELPAAVNYLLTQEGSAEDAT